MRQPGKRLQDKVAIISGGASGIGAETARVFAAHGASVVICDVQEELGHQFVREIAADGGVAEYRPLDVCSEEQWLAVVAAAEKTYGHVDVLGNIAGISGRPAGMTVQTGHFAGGMVGDQTLESWNRIMEVNSTGVFLGTKSVIPAMQRAGGGSIINMSSICGCSPNLPRSSMQKIGSGRIRCIPASSIPRWPALACSATKAARPAWTPPRSAASVSRSTSRWAAYIWRPTNRPG